MVNTSTRSQAQSNNESTDIFNAPILLPIFLFSFFLFFKISAWYSSTETTGLLRPNPKYPQRIAPLQTLFLGKMGDADFDKYLRVESQQFNQENEVKRVLNLMQNGNKDPLMVLEYPTDIYVTLRVDEKSLKKQFR